MSNLILEFNEKFKKAHTEFGNSKSIVSITPPINEDYWIFRVKLFEEQSLLGFPKFFTIGIGFAQENDWNTNLPYSCDAEAIYKHISHNKKYKQIKKADCIQAIKMIQEAAKTFQSKEVTA